MGVPVITFAGGNFVGRMGASFLHTLDEPDWVATDETDYVARAAALAAGIDTLRGQRAGLRSKMSRSPLCDIDTYVGHLEAIYRRMWAVHCTAGAQRILPMLGGW